MSAAPHRAPRIVLASRSPRRLELLAQIGVRCEVAPADIDEQRHRAEDAPDYVLRMAREKAQAVRARRGASAMRAVPVLGADTAVVIDGDVLGKPASREEARAQLSRLSGRAHEVLSAVALSRADTEVRLSRSRVWLRDISARERDAYCATDEPVDKAGAYAIQGLAGVFVVRLEGSYSGVMGLPLFETAELLRGAGIEVL